MKEKEKCRCPGCRLIISNVVDLVEGKKYKCTKCGIKYFLVKIPKEVYLNNS